MKLTFKSLLACLTALVFLLVAGSTGCSKKIAVDTVQLEYSFQTADSTTQSTVTEAITAIEKADYSGAAEKLKKVAADPKLTAEQKTAVNGVLQQIEKK